MTSTCIEIAGALFGLLGTFLLARNDKHSGWGFAVYLASNLAWTWFAVAHGHWFMLVQYIGFTAVSLYGVWRWLIIPRSTPRAEAASAIDTVAAPVRPS